MKRGEKVIVDNFNELEEWRKAEIMVQHWFAKNYFRAEWMESIKRNYRGFDILVEGRYRIDVKFSQSKTRNLNNEYQFNIGKKRKQKKTTDFYLLMFKDIDKNGKEKYRAFLLPYEDVGCQDYLTITKSRLEKWSEYKFNLENVRKNKIFKTIILKDGKLVA